MTRSRDPLHLQLGKKPGLRAAIAVFLLLLIGSPALGNAVGAHIKMLSKATVDKDPVLLADIATIQGNNPDLVAALGSITVGRAPMPGESRQIHAAYVALRLKQHGIPIEQVTLEQTAVTTMVRSSTHVSRKDIETAIRKALRDTDLFQGREGVIKDILIPKDLVAPAGTVSFRVKFPENLAVSNTIPVSVSVFVDNTYYRKIWTTLKAEVLQEVLVLKYAMRRHQRITAENVQQISMNVADIPQNAITIDQDIIGQRVTKSLLPGTVLRTDTVELPPLVKRGDMVILQAASGVLQVTALGQAKSNGQQGERIRIVNIDTNKELYGYVVDAKTVKVIF
jgi:flagella basal body P-ring formation protein FlgA